VGHRVGIPGLATCRVGREREHVFGHLGTDRPGLGTAALESLAEQLAGQKCQVRVPGPPGASWGHRKNNLLRTQDELFYGWYLSAGAMVPEENGPAVPELARRATVSSCRHDPVRGFAPVLTALTAAGIGLGDILGDSGYAHRDSDAWAVPLRAAGVQLIQDLHPHDRGPKGTHAGAERGFATAKDPATNHITRGWCRLMGPAPLMLFTTTLLIVRNQRILAAWNTRQQENARRAAQGLPPRTRRRRRKTLTILTRSDTSMSNARSGRPCICRSAPDSR
jgi:hypothetical protein